MQNPKIDYWIFTGEDTRWITRLKYLVQIDFGKVEPFADENDDRSAELVNSALIEASDSGHFAQVLRLGAAQ